MMHRRGFLAALPSLVLAGRWVDLDSRLPLVYGERGIVSRSDPISDLQAMVKTIETAPTWAPSFLLVPGDVVKFIREDGQDELFQITGSVSSAEGERLTIRSMGP